MADIASIGYSIDTSSVVAATADLEHHAEAAKKVAIGVKELDSAQATATATTQKATGANDNLARSHLALHGALYNTRTAVRGMTTELMGLASAGASATTIIGAVAGGVGGIIGGFIAGTVISTAHRAISGLIEGIVEWRTEALTGSKMIEEAFKSQEEQAKRLKEAYESAGKAMPGIFQLGAASNIASAGANLTSSKEAEEKLRQNLENAFHGNSAQLQSSAVGAIYNYFFGNGEAASKLDGAFRDLDERLSAGTINAKEMGEALGRLSVQFPQYQSYIKTFEDLATTWGKGAANLDLATEAAKRFRYIEEYNKTRSATEYELRYRGDGSPEVNGSQIADFQAQRAEGIRQQQIELRALGIQQEQQAYTSWGDAILKGTQALELQAAVMGKTEPEAASLRSQMELTNTAMRTGLVLTPQLTAQIEALSAGYGQAALAAQKYGDEIKLMDSSRDATRGFFSDIAHGAAEGQSALEMLTTALTNLASKLMDVGIDQIVQGLLGRPGTPGQGSLLGPSLWGLLGGTQPAAPPIVGSSTASTAAAFAGNAIGSAGQFTPYGALGSPSSGGAYPYSSTIASAAAQYGLDPNLLAGLIKKESSFNPNARPPIDPATGRPITSAVGLTQLTTAAQKDVGVTNPYDPTQSIYGGAHYLAIQRDANGGNMNAALGHYYAGPGGDINTPAAQSYVQDVNANAAAMRQAAQASTSASSTFSTSFPTALQSTVSAVANPGAGGSGGLLSWLFGGSSSAAGTSSFGGHIGVGSYYHSGGIVPRLHNGLGPDEFPAILQRGEQVIPKSQVGKGTVIHIGGPTINVAGNVDKETLKEVHGMIRANNAEQHKALQREIGGIQSKFAMRHG